ncbi:MAG: DNA replication/repair protein RecF [Actinobacteria bacterium]|nr:DNA replication/repair protein RecF [Actinomycetota bacterium]
MRLHRLWLTDVRCYHDVELTPAPGATVVVGANGQGKTTLLEAIAWVATTQSFRGVPDAALVRDGRDVAIVRAEFERDRREQRLEAEIRASGRNRILLNRRPLARRRDLAGSLRVTVFSPDDLELVKGGPAGRRRYLDDLLAASAPRYDAARTDYDRVLRQRNALLKSGLRGPDDEFTLDVFDEQLARAGGELVRGRLRLVERLQQPLTDAYRNLARTDVEIGATYEAGWAESSLDAAHVGDVESWLRAALGSRRREELARATTLIGPHRDEWRLRVTGLDARTHASQGEQRTMALALRLAGHRVTGDVIGEDPVLLLDDVFSELDASRAAALVECLPSGQTLLTTAGQLPEGVHPERFVRVDDGRVLDG